MVQTTFKKVVPRFWESPELAWETVNIKAWPRPWNASKLCLFWLPTSDDWIVPWCFFILDMHVGAKNVALRLVKGLENKTHQRNQLLHHWHDKISPGRGRHQLPELSEHDDAWQQPWSLALCGVVLGVDTHAKLGSGEVSGRKIRAASTRAWTSITHLPPPRKGGAIHSSEVLPQYAGSMSFTSCSSRLGGAMFVLALEARGGNMVIPRPSHGMFAGYHGKGRLDLAIDTENHKLGIRSAFICRQVYR